MKAVDYKRTILKEMCRKYNIEYDEEQMNSWFYYRVSLADTQRNWKIYLVDTLLVKENLEEYIAEQLLGPLARSGIHLKEKDFFEEYVDKITFRHCTKGDKFRGVKYKDEIVVFLKNEITTFGISKEELEGFVDLTRLTNFFGIDFKVKESEKYEYVTTTNSIYKTTGGDKSLMETGEYDKGMLFF